MEKGKETWNFAVIGSDLNNVPKYLGFVNTREQAAKLQKNAEINGWRRVAVFDADLKEVKGG